MSGPSLSSMRNFGEKFRMLCTDREAAQVINHLLGWGSAKSGKSGHRYRALLRKTLAVQLDTFDLVQGFCSEIAGAAAKRERIQPPFGAIRR
jgi:hypothetical protein